LLSEGKYQEAKDLAASFEASDLEYYDKIMKGEYEHLTKHFALTDIALPYGITSIDSSLFNGNYSLTSITLPNSVTSIGAHAFDGCSSLTSITIPDSVTSIGESAFKYCYSLTSITLPNSITLIGKSAFWECSNLTSIHFNGTKAQWNAISKGIIWDERTGNYTIYCTDGNITK